MKRKRGWSRASDAAPDEDVVFMASQLTRRREQERNRVSDVDPYGDVILVVSPPKQRREYAPSRLYLDGEAGVARYRASSKHLSLASRYFKRRLWQEQREGAASCGNGCIEMDVPHTDPKVFLILLHLMHSRTQEVPTSVTFDELVELAVQVKYFGCRGVLGLYPAKWIEPWIAKRPNTYCAELVKWIFISGMFNDRGLYASLTSLAIRRTRGHIDTLGLPIPVDVTDGIYRKRKDLLYALFKAVDARRQQLETGEITCTFECDSLRLGALMKQMKAHGLPWPRENLNYKGLAPESVARKIREFEKPSSKISCKGRCGGLVGGIDEIMHRQTESFGLTLLLEQWQFGI